MSSNLAVPAWQLLVWMAAALQAIGLAVVTVRPLPGRNRVPAVPPGDARALGSSERVSVVVPARNEGARIAPCLDGLLAQDSVMREAIVVDGNSTDDTVARIDAITARDARIRRIAEPPRPAGMVGRPWAIAAGCRSAEGEWILVVDADVAPGRGMVAGAATDAADRVIANGQCLLMRASILEHHGGYEIAARSFCDDIRIVRHLAERGARVGFLDGTRLFDVLMYRDAAETWRGWPRSLDMRDATRPLWRWVDSAFLVLTQALPVPLLAVALFAAIARGGHGLGALIGVQIALLLVRVMLLFAIAPSFARRGVPFWLSPLADPLAALRVVETTLRRPREWRGTATPLPRANLPS